MVDNPLCMVYNPFKRIVQSSMTGGKTMKTKNMVLCAVFAAILSVLAVITIPIGPVPITLAFLGVMLTGIVLGPKLGSISVFVYLLLGCIGLPVFSGFKGGFQVLLGPTGGYAWSYIIMAFIIGFMTKKLPHKKWLSLLKIFFSCIVGIIVGYAAGTIQFIAITNTGLAASLALCVLPFIPFDIAKAAAAAFLGYKISQTIKKSS